MPRGRLDTHPLYGQLLDWERELARLLISGEPAERLPTHSDFPVARPLVAAAETVSPRGEGIILVGPDRQFADAWRLVWEQRGSYATQTASASLEQPFPVVLASIEELGFYEEELRGRQDRLFIASNLPDEQYDYACQVLGRRQRVWRLLSPDYTPRAPQGVEAYLWELIHGEAWTPVVAPGRRARLSPLAERSRGRGLERMARV